MGEATTGRRRVAIGALLIGLAGVIGLGVMLRWTPAPAVEEERPAAKRITAEECVCEEPGEGECWVLADLGAILWLPATGKPTFLRIPPPWRDEPRGRSEAVRQLGLRLGVDFGYRKRYAVESFERTDLGDGRTRLEMRLTSRLASDRSGAFDPTDIRWYSQPGESTIELVLDTGSGVGESTLRVIREAQGRWVRAGDTAFIDK